jgi:hypothetical protein
MQGNQIALEKQLSLEGKLHVPRASSSDINKSVDVKTIVFVPASSYIFLFV